MTSTAITLSRRSNRWTALALIVTAQFMVVLDMSIVNVALATIKNDLGFSQASLQWVITAYAIVFGGFLLLGGRLADLLGAGASSSAASRSSPSAPRSAAWPGRPDRSSSSEVSRASAARCLRPPASRS